MGIIISLSTLAFAEGGAINSGDTAWVTISTALVMMMTPAESR